MSRVVRGRAFQTPAASSTRVGVQRSGGGRRSRGSLVECGILQLSSKSSMFTASHLWLQNGHVHGCQTDWGGQKRKQQQQQKPKTKKCKRSHVKLVTIC